MLVLSRKPGETISIGNDIEIVVQKVSGGRVAIGVKAPGSVRILRGELDSGEAFQPSDESEQAPGESESHPESAASGAFITDYAAPKIAADNAC